MLEFPQGTVTAGLVLALLPPGRRATRTRSRRSRPGAIGADVLDPFEPQPKLMRGGVTVAGDRGRRRPARLGAGIGGPHRRAAGSLRPQALVLRCGRTSAKGPARRPTCSGRRSCRARTIRCCRPRRRRRRAAPARSPSCGSLLERATEGRGRRRVAAARGRRRPAAVRPRAERAGSRCTSPPTGTRTSRARSSSRASSSVKLVIEGGNEAWKLAKELKAIDAAVILRVAPLPPVGTSAQAPIFRAGGRGEPRGRGRCSRPRASRSRSFRPTDAEAGEPRVPRDADDRARVRVDRRARRPSRSNAAKILGVDADVGTLATGRRADLARVARRAASRRPRARPRDRGRPRRAAREAADDLIAITAKRVHTCAGDALDRAHGAGRRRQDPRRRAAHHDPARRAPHRRRQTP